MDTTRRRAFLMTLVGGGSALALAGSARAASVAATDPQAQALGYQPDTSRVDQAKYPNHAAAQSCSNCQLYQGKPGDAEGGCPLFAGKQVAAHGWCSAYTKKS